MEKVILPNGLRVLLDWQDHARSASFGVWVKSGPVYENKENNGISHFMEHMVFNLNLTGLIGSWVQRDLIMHITHYCN